MVKSVQALSLSKEVATGRSLKMATDWHMKIVTSKSSCVLKLWMANPSIISSNIEGLLLLGLFLVLDLVLGGVEREGDVESPSSELNTWFGFWDGWVFLLRGRFCEPWPPSRSMATAPSVQHRSSQKYQHLNPECLIHITAYFPRANDQSKVGKNARISKDSTRKSSRWRYGGRYGRFTQQVPLNILPPCEK